MARPTKYTEDMCETVIECGRIGMGKAEMAREIGVSRDTFNHWEKDEDKPEFSDAVKEAVALSQAWWEEKGRENILGERDFNATNYIFQMKNRFPRDWRDKQDVEHSGTVVTKVARTIVDPRDSDS